MLEVFKEQNNLKPHDEDSVTQEQDATSKLRSISQQVEDSSPEPSVLREGLAVGKPAARKKILFDEYHEELLCSHVTDSEADTWSTLRRELEEEWHWEVKSHSADDGLLSYEQLDGYDVLVLAAPRRELTLAEIDAIVDFVGQGKALLFSNNYDSLWLQTSNSTNVLLESFGLRVEQLLSRRPDEVSTLYPHYLNTEVRQLRIRKPVYLKILNDTPSVVAALPETSKPFLAAVDANPGRVVAIGDFVIFGDRYIRRDNNCQLALNIFRWLTYQNPLDCRDTSVTSEVFYGQTATFSITLSNPHQTRLEHIHCLLESDTGSLIREPLQSIRSIPPKGQTRLQWLVEPQQLGLQTLRLTVDFRDGKYSSLFFDSAAQFWCVPDAELDLVFLNHHGKVQEFVETGIPFEVQAMTRWTTGAKQYPIHLGLKYPRSHITAEQTGENRWQLNALDAGDWTVTLEAKESNQTISRLVHAYPSAKNQIAAMEQDIVSLLAAEIYRHVLQIRREFDTDEIRQIPFRIFTPDDQVRLLYYNDYNEVREHLLEALHVARSTTQRFSPLVEELLRFIAPMYSPIHGCCIPYDPELASHLAKMHPTLKENLAYNFLCLSDDSRYSQTWIEGNIAALILHEKYGHGFFFTQTTLGKQLAILYRHGFLRSVDYEGMKSLYPSILQKEYSFAIQAIYDSTLVINEGFATWIELTVLQNLSGVVSQAVYRRKDFLFNYDKRLRHLLASSEYFKHLDSKPSCDSIYREGWQYLDAIQGYFGSDCGPKCSVQAFIKAADIDLGISEQGGQLHFGLEADTLQEALIESSGDDARADMRLRRIELILNEFQEKIREDQERLQCHRRCLHSECPVNRIIAERLGW